MTAGPSPVRFTSNGRFVAETLRQTAQSESFLGQQDPVADVSTYKLNQMCVIISINDKGEPLCFLITESLQLLMLE